MRPSIIAQPYFSSLLLHMDCVIVSLLMGGIRWCYDNRNMINLNVSDLDGKMSTRAWKCVAVEFVLNAKGVGRLDKFVDYKKFVLKKIFNKKFKVLFVIKFQNDSKFLFTQLPPLRWLLLFSLNAFWFTQECRFWLWLFMFLLPLFFCLPLLNSPCFLLSTAHQPMPLWASRDFHKKALCMRLRNSS